jgi:hypothetical protein
LEHPHERLARAPTPGVAWSQPAARSRWLSYGELGRVGRRSGREMSNDRAPAPVRGEVSAVEPAASRAATTVRSLPLVAALTVCCALSACGSEAPATVAQAPAAAARTTGAPATGGAAPALARAEPSSTTSTAPRSKRSTARSASTAPLLIPPPRTSSAKRGRLTCEAASPEQIRRRFLKSARARSSKRDARFLKLVAAPSKGNISNAAALAARVYAMSVSEADRAGAYAGCVYELSKMKESGR